MSESTSNWLRREHRVIERVLRVLRSLVGKFEAGGAFPADDFRDCVKFFRLFADACHHGKEEDLLFPAMEAQGMPHDTGPIAVMLYEHRVGRECVKKMATELDAHAAGDEKAPNTHLTPRKTYDQSLDINAYA